MIRKKVNWICILLLTSNVAHADLYETSRIPITVLSCSHAAKKLERHLDAEKLEALGEFLVHEIFDDYAKGIISKYEMQRDTPALFYMLIEPYDRLPEGDIDFLTEAVVESFSNGELTYEMASRGKTGVGAFTAQRNKAEDIYGENQCQIIVDVLN